MSMKLVKQLRQATGARLVDCKAAVEATTGLEEAFQWLREKGASRAAKLVQLLFHYLNSSFFIKSFWI